MYIEKTKIYTKEKRNENKWRNFKNEYIGRGISILCGILIVFITLSIILFVTLKGMNLFINGYPIKEFLFSINWNPDLDIPSFGAGVFILGSIFVSLGAIIIAAPISIALAIFINYISPKLGEKIVKPSLELFVGIPSVVYGWLGISILVPILKTNSNGVGFSLLAGVIVVSIMILPTIASIATDAMKVVPKSYLEASYGLGATRFETITKVVLPSAKTGILTGVVLGITRAFGEALAVQMVIGNSIKLPKNIFSSTSTVTSVITMDMANTISNTPWNNALWSLAFLLLIMSFISIVTIKVISKRGEVK